VAVFKRLSTANTAIFYQKEFIMHSQIYVNLPVRDLKKSRAFFESMGYSFNPEFSNDQGACLVLGENLFAMLLEHAFFKTFISKNIVDAKTSTEVLVCVSCDSKSQVDALVSKALAAGGAASRPAVDHGFMYQHSYEDLDGHIWELVATTTT
jgi:uncharacterized protein